MHIAPALIFTAWSVLADGFGHAFFLALAAISIIAGPFVGAFVAISYNIFSKWVGGVLVMIEAPVQNSAHSSSDPL